MRTQRRTPMVCAAALVLSACQASPPPAPADEPTGSARLPMSSSPSSRTGMALTYDAHDQALLLVGGCKTSEGLSCPTGNLVQETWTFGASGWTQHTPTHAPPARAGAALVHDPVRHVTVLFGGTAGSQALSDTWEWNGADWTQVNGSAPPARAGAVAVFDPVRGAVVLHGGVGQGGYALDDVWAYAGTWSVVAASTGSPCPGAAALGFRTASGKPVRAGCAVTAGGVTSKLAELSGSTWTPLAETGAPQATTYGRAMAHDKAHDRFLAFGGFTVPSATDPGGNTPTGYLVSGQPYAWSSVAAAAGLRGRTLHAMAFDGDHSRFYVYGGLGDSGALSDLWAFDGTAWSLAHQPCQAATDCATGAYLCVNGACTLGVADGGACSADAQCGSGHCADGVCCNAPCDGQCVACDLPGKAGKCSVVTGAPVGGRAACAGAGTACGGQCDGITGAECTYPVAECTQASCHAGVLQPAAMCDGAGSCAPTSAVPCGGFQCDPSSCKTSCAGLADCLTGYHCLAGVCVADPASGPITCAADADCATGHCADGVCCDTACTGQCEACNVPGQEGVCSAVSGLPHAPRSPCEGDGSECSGRCDGTERAACVFSTDVCRSALCSKGAVVGEATCDGQGHCPAPEKTSCGAYQCADRACLTTCAGVEDCAAGHACREGRCEPLGEAPGATDVGGAGGGGGTGGPRVTEGSGCSASGRGQPGGGLGWLVALAAGLHVARRRRSVRVR